MNDTIYIYPTDTVWGIGGNILSEAVYSKIISIKIRDAGKPVSILFSSISMMREYFTFPERYTDQWLQDFFSYESTALLPVDWLKVKMPNHITHGSLWVGVRCLTYTFIEDLTREVGGPVITTSLNQSGERPIIEIELAKNFHRKYAVDATLITPEGIGLSGAPSSIIKFDECQGELFLRKGKYTDELERHIQVLPA
jgi:L-threonylcarbamoyladenylate synthase